MKQNKPLKQRNIFFAINSILFLIKAKKNVKVTKYDYVVSAKLVFSLWNGWFWRFFESSMWPQVLFSMLEVSYYKPTATTTWCLLHGAQLQTCSYRYVPSLLTVSYGPYDTAHIVQLNNIDFQKMQSSHLFQLHWTSDLKMFYSTVWLYRIQDWDFVLVQIAKKLFSPFKHQLPNVFR